MQTHKHAPILPGGFKKVQTATPILSFFNAMLNLKEHLVKKIVEDLLNNEHLTNDPDRSKRSSKTLQILDKSSKDPLKILKRSSKDPQKILKRLSRDLRQVFVNILIEVVSSRKLQNLLLVLCREFYICFSFGHLADE